MRQSGSPLQVVAIEAKGRWQGKICIGHEATGITGSGPVGLQVFELKAT
jgi:hypothetical protein